MNIIENLRHSLLEIKAELIFKKLLIDFESFKTILRKKPGYDGTSIGFYKSTTINDELLRILNEKASNMNAKVFVSKNIDIRTNQEYLLYQLTNIKDYIKKMENSSELQR